MQQVFVEDAALNNNIVTITGSDAVHMNRVLRMKPGEKIRVSTQSGVSMICVLTSLSDEEVQAKVTDAKVRQTELDGRILLFQALPKGDRLETVVEKAVELGASDIYPVAMEHCITKWEESKRAKKQQRFQAIAQAAAMQSKRSRIPDFHELVTFPKALEIAQKECDIRILPYENARGMVATKELLAKIKKDSDVAIFIGPEGGFSDKEIEMAKGTCELVSLGERILRTDTAGILSVGMVMLAKEMGI